MTPQQAVQRAEQIGAETRYRNQLARQMYQAGRHDAEADTARRGHRPPARSRMASPTPGWRSRGGPGGRVRLADPRPGHFPGRGATTSRTRNRKGSSMNDYTGAIATGAEHEVDGLHPAAPHPGAFGISTGHPVPPGLGADVGPGPVNHHPGPDFAPREPEAGS